VLGLRPQRILEIGCGTGLLLFRLAPHCAEYWATDFSEGAVQYVGNEAEAAGIAGVRVIRAAADDFTWLGDQRFDVIVLNSVVQYFPSASYLLAVLRSAVKALRPGGRMSLLVWQPAADNEWFLDISTALSGGRQFPAPPPEAPGPFSLGDPDRARARIEAGGFEDIAFTGVREPMGFGPDADTAYDFIVGLLSWMLEGLDDAGRARALGELRSAVAAHEGEDGVHFGSAMWLVTAVRR